MDWSLSNHFDRFFEVTLPEFYLTTLISYFQKEMMTPSVIQRANPEFSCQAFAVFAKPPSYKYRNTKATSAGFYVDILRREILAYSYLVTQELQKVRDFSHGLAQISLN